MRDHSDVGVIADFPDETSLVAAEVAETICRHYGMTPDAHAGACLSPAFKAEAESRGRVLA